MTKTELYEFIFVILQQKEEVRTSTADMKTNTDFREIKKTDLQMDEHAIGFGAMLLCKSGMAEIQINFGQWQLSTDSFISFFPNDIILWKNATDDFSAEAIVYSAEVLRAASMNIEHEIYRELRDERVCSNDGLIQNVVKALFSMFRFYYNDPYIPSVDKITAHLVQAFFIGFADFMRYHPDSPQTQTRTTSRSRQLFARFMQLLEEKYQEGHEVMYYASKMNISTKYLGKIAREHTGLTAKHLINDYRVQQLKLALSTTTMSLKEITHAFNFSDQSALTRYFKAHTGQSPKDYRK